MIKQVFRDNNYQEQKMTTYYYADCDKFDNHRTGWHLSEQGAIDSFWNENVFTDHEKKYLIVYTGTIKNPTDEELAEQAEIAETEGLICVTNPEMARFAK